MATSAPVARWSLAGPPVRARGRWTIRIPNSSSYRKPLLFSLITSSFYLFSWFFCSLSFSFFASSEGSPSFCPLLMMTSLQHTHLRETLTQVLQHVTMGSRVITSFLFLWVFGDWANSGLVKFEWAAAVWSFISLGALKQCSLRFFFSEKAIIGRNDGVSPSALIYF